MQSITDQSITNKQHQEISGESGEKSRKFCVLGMQPQAAVLANYLEKTWDQGNTERPALLVFQDGHGNSETLPFKQIIYRDQESEIDYMVVPFNDLYDNCNHVLPLLNKVLKNMQSQKLLKIRYKDGEANPMKHKRVESKENHDYDVPHLKPGKVTPENYIDQLDETIILIEKSQWSELIDALINYDGAKTKDMEDKQNEEKAVIVPISDRKGKPLEDYEVTKRVMQHDIEMEKTRQKFHIDDEGNKS